MLNEQSTPLESISHVTNATDASNVQPEESKIVEPVNINLESEKTKTKNLLPAAMKAANLMNKKLSIGSIEVETLLTKRKFNITKLSVLDDATIKSLNGGLSMYTDALLKTFYKCVEVADDKPFTYDDFLDLPEADFTIILYAIFRASFTTLVGGKRTFICTNENCPSPTEDKDGNKTFTHDFTCKDLDIKFPNEAYTGSDPKTHVFKYNREFVDFEFQFPKIGELLELLKKKSNSEVRALLSNGNALATAEELIATTLKRVTLRDDDSETLVLDTKLDIELFLKALDVTSKEIVYEQIGVAQDEIKKWTPLVVGKTICPYCTDTSVEREENFDLLVEMFLKFSTLYAR